MSNAWEILTDKKKIAALKDKVEDLASRIDALSANLGVAIKQIESLQTALEQANKKQS
jgi:hypothetical protein